MSKTIKFDLIRELDNGGTEVEKIVVKKLKVRQFTGVLSIVAEIFDVLDQHPGLKDMLLELVVGRDEFDPAQYEGYSPEALAEAKEIFEGEKDARWFEIILSSFRTLLISVPDQTVRLVARAANVDSELLYDQEFDVLFDIVKAITEVNDVEEVVERGKMSFKAVRGAFQFMKTKPATEEQASGPLQ